MVKRRKPNMPSDPSSAFSYRAHPNHLVRELISQWCKHHGTELPPPQDINDGFVTDADRNNLNALLEKLSSTVPEQKKAAKKIRVLTRRMPSFRSFFGESTNALPHLLAPLTTSGSLTDHLDLQEDLITTLLNISIHENNKKLIAEHPLVIPLLIESLKCGSIETKANAAAAFSHCRLKFQRAVQWLKF